MTKPKDDGTRHGRMVGKHPALGMPYGRPSPTGRLVEGPSYLLSAFLDQPLVEQVEGDTYEAFVDRYTKDWSPLYRPGGKMSDYLRQSLAGFREGQRYIFHNGHVVHENRIDDIYGRAARRFNQKVREYCRQDVLIFGDYAATEMRILLTMLNGGRPPMLALPAPYGRGPSSPDWGIAISIRYTGILPRRYVDRSPVDDHPWPDRQEADMIGGAVIGFGCPDFVARRVADAMYGSGRYDCSITLSRHAIRNLQQTMEELRCEVIVVCDDRHGHMRYGYAPDSDRDIK
jgi:hypothetical protein